MLAEDRDSPSTILLSFRKQNQGMTLSTCTNLAPRDLGRGRGSLSVITSPTEVLQLGSDGDVQIENYVVTVGGRNPREDRACQVPIRA